MYLCINIYVHMRAAYNMRLYDCHVQLAVIRDVRFLCPYNAVFLRICPVHAVSRDWHMRVCVSSASTTLAESYSLSAEITIISEFAS